MGSCFSRKKKKTLSSETAYFHQKSPHAESHTLLLPNRINAFPPPPPPPPPLQEEIVKEVLQLSVFPKPEPKEKHAKGEKKEEIEVSDYFEIDSLRETASTVMMAERKEKDNGCDEIEMLQKQKKRSSPAASRRKMSASGGFQEMVERGLRSPARTSDPLSEPRTPALETGWSSRGLPPAGNSGSRRDRGEVSGRSSRSPACWMEVGQSPSGRKTCRCPTGAPAEEMEDGGWKVEEEGGAPPKSWESFEKPLISLECFIFL